MLITRVVRLRVYARGVRYVRLFELFDACDVLNGLRCLCTGWVDWFVIGLICQLLTCFVCVLCLSVTCVHCSKYVCIRLYMCCLACSCV